MEPKTRIYQNRSGTFELHVSWPGTGKRTRKSLHTKSEEEAQKLVEVKGGDMVSALEAELFGEEKAQTEHPRLEDMADWYFEIKLPQAGAAPNTIRNYKMSIGSLVRYAKARRVYTVNQLSSRLIQDWQASAHSGRARRDDLLATRFWLKEYLRFHPGTRIPALQWVIPKKLKRSRFKALTRDQLGEALSRMAQVNPELHRVVSWIAYTGWLTSDTLDLRYGEVRDKHPDRYIDRERLKTSRRMVLPLTGELIDLISQERARLDIEPRPNDVVFRNKQGGPWRYPQFAQMLNYFCRSRLDFGVCARDLRVTYGTFMAEAGCPQHILAELMGHDDVTMALKYYTRVNFEGMEKAARQYTENVRRLAEGA